MEIEQMYSAPWRWSLLLSVIILNICLPSLVLSYGTYILYSDDDGVPATYGVLTPVFFTCVYCLTQCWCRDAADSWGEDKGYRWLASIGLVLVSIGVLLCAFIPIDFHSYIYGTLGGFGSSLISAQVDAVIFDVYDNRLGIIRGLCFFGQAIGLFVFPHILAMIIYQYGLYMSYLLLSGIIVQMLPAIMFLTIDESAKYSISYSKFSDFSRNYASVIPDSYFTNTNDLQLHDLSRKCWKSPSDDNLHMEDEFGENIVMDDNDNNSDLITVTPPPSPEERRRNIYGVEILPGIPEESESSDSSDTEQIGVKNKNVDKKRLNTTIRRLSILSDNFDECISKQIRKDSLSDCNEVEITHDTILPQTDVRHVRILTTFRDTSMYLKFKRHLCIPSYRSYRIKRRLLHLLYSINDTLMKPLTTSLLCWRFYPALLLCLSKLCLTAMLLPLIPIASTKINPKISITETNFLMSLIAFTWMCFLVSTPWIVNMSKRNLKYFVIIGLITSTAACVLITRSRSNSVFAVACLIAGFGFGAITSCWEATVQNFIGPKNWSQIHSPLETLSGTTLLALTLALFFIYPKDSLQKWLTVLGGVLALTTVVWSIIATVMFCKAIVKNIKRKNMFN